MSRNFDLLRQLENSSETQREPAPRANIEEVPPREIPRAKVDEPADKEIPRAGNKQGVNEEISRLVQSLFFSQKGRELRNIVFCGVEDDSGSSFLCADVGRNLAARSELVCLVDANLPACNLSRYFGVSLVPPRNTFFPPPVKERCVKVETNLWLARPDLLANEQGALLPADEIARVFARLRSVYSFVLIDTQSTSVSRDAALFGNLADAAVLVVEASVTRKPAARKAKEFLDAAGVLLIGTILNNRSFPIPETLYKRI
jgi:Mrp family chromosome partitioning ATPase